MVDAGLIWIPATLLASAGQVARNTMQRRLTDMIGTVGAAQVRFLYGFPFSVLFLTLIVLVTGERIPWGGGEFIGFLLLGALTQIMATILMLAAMRARSFSVVTALLKTEAVQIAVFGFIVLGDRLSPLGATAVVVTTLGVATMSWSPKVAGDATNGGARPIVLGIAAGAMFALSAVGFRGAILALDGGSFVVRAGTALTASLALQTLLLGAWMIAFDRTALMGSLREWRSSVLAGFMGAAASQFWFIGFALTPAANVRTLALVEVLMAQAVSRRFLAQATSWREYAGMALILAGVLMLLVASR